MPRLVYCPATGATPIARSCAELQKRPPDSLWGDAVLTKIAAVSSPQSEPSKNHSQQESGRQQPHSWWYSFFWDIRVTDTFLALFTGALVIVGYVQAKRLRETIELGNKEFIGTHRPRIRIKHLWITNDILDDNILRMTLLFTNTGDVPARINSWGLTTVIIPRDGDLPPSVDPQGVPPLIRQPMGLGQTFRFNNITDGRVLTHQQCVDLRAGATRLFCVGHVEYLDTNDPPRIRRTNFCRVLVFPANRRPDNDTFRFHRVDDAEYEYED